jgi:hypothetical protein
LDRAEAERFPAVDRAVVQIRQPEHKVLASFDARPMQPLQVRPEPSPVQRVLRVKERSSA